MAALPRPGAHKMQKIPTAVTSLCRAARLRGVGLRRSHDGRDDDVQVLENLPEPQGIDRGCWGCP